MKRLELLKKEQPQLEIQLAENKSVILTRKRILAKDADAHGKYLSELGEARIRGEMSDVDYTFSVIEALVDGFDREAFGEVDIYDLNLIATAVGEMGRESAAEKKSE